MHAGLAHLHQRNFFHRDLKLENVAVSEDQVVKLIDLGSSTYYSHYDSNGVMHRWGTSMVEYIDGGAVAAERTQVISLSQKAHTRAPEVVLGHDVVLGQSDKEQEKVRRTCIIPAVGQNRSKN
jgi:serine/threonine protein kinase